MDLIDNFELQIEDIVLQLYFSGFDAQVCINLEESTSSSSEAVQASSGGIFHTGLYILKTIKIF